MIVLIMDSLRQQTLVEELKIPEDVPRYCAPIQVDEPVVRGIYIASLNSGGTKMQLDVIRNNPHVEEWFVLSVGTEEESWLSFRDRLYGVAAPVHTFSDKQALLDALQRPVIQKNSCLVLQKQENPDVDNVIMLLKKLLPSWTFQKAFFGENPKACFETSCSRMLLLGREPYDFFGVQVPESAKPIVGVTRIEENVLAFRQPAKIRRDIFGSISGFHWSEEIQNQNFYLISTLYEGLRLEVKMDPEMLNSLEKDSRFDMWDIYGLPECRSAYTKKHMLEFLSQFDSCERIAASLQNKA